MKPTRHFELVHGERHYRCGRCGKCLPPSAYYGNASYCIPCHKAYNKERYAKRVMVASEPARETIDSLYIELLDDLRQVAESRSLSFKAAMTLAVQSRLATRDQPPTAPLPPQPAGISQEQLQAILQQLNQLRVLVTSCLRVEESGAQK